MKSTDKYMLVLVASLALLLAGCGGGSSSTPTTPTTPPVNPGPTPSDQLATANKIIMLHEEASGATADAEAAGMAVAQAVKDATKYSTMFDTASVKGDSTKAMMNAQMVLDARAAVTQAVMDAEAAKMRAMDAKTEAEALADGTAGKAEVIVALDAAIKAAEAELVTVTAISTGVNADNRYNSDGTALKTAVAAVTGTAAKLKTPDDKAGEVAMAVAGALVPTVTEAPGATADGTAMRVEHYATSASLPTLGGVRPNDEEHTFLGNNSIGRTWAEIAGKDNIMMERIGANNAAVPVASIAGFTSEEAIPNEADNLGANTSVDDLTRYTNAAHVSNYLGIPGDVWCLGDDCKVVDGILTGSWYFTPDSTSDFYVLRAEDQRRSDNTNLYVVDTDYVIYGHWLNVVTTAGDTFGQVTVHTYAYPAGNTGSLDLTEATTAGAVNTATYTGEAVGMSVHKTFDGNRKQTGIHSGAFTADVSLTATFAGAASTLSGTVNNFQGGAHTDGGWSVALQETSLNATGGFDALGVAKGSGQAGDWSTQGYGISGERPTGFFGNFEAHFTDGHASGAYATR